MYCTKCDDEKPDAEMGQSCQQVNCSGIYAPPLETDIYAAYNF